MRAKKVYESVGEWEFTEETAAGTVTRNNKSITGQEGIIYHPGQVATAIMVNEVSNQDSSFEFLKNEDFLDKRKKELKKEGYYISDSKTSKGFTAKKDDKRIVVRLDESKKEESKKEEEELAKITKRYWENKRKNI